MKRIKGIFFLAVMVASVWLGGLIGDAQALRNDILRLHVVANSDSEEDQAVKIRVRDAVLAALEEGMEKGTGPKEAVAYAKTMIPKLTKVFSPKSVRLLCAKALLLPWHGRLTLEAE